MKKWYADLTGEQIITEVENMTDSIVSLVEKGLTELAFKLEKDLQEVIKELRSSIVEIKTSYYMYNKDTYEYWEDTLYSINGLMHHMTRHEMNIYREKGWL